MMIRLRNTATGAVVKVSEAKAERLRRDGWVSADTTAKPTSNPKTEAKPKSEEKTPVEAKPKTEEKLPGDTPVPSKSWKAAELEAYAKEHGVDLGSARTKDEILAAITAAAPPAGDEPQGDEPTEAKTASESGGTE